MQRIEEKTRPIPQMSSTGVSIAVFKKVIARLHNWKCPGVDKLHNFWYKKLTCLYNSLHHYVNRFISNPQDCPESLGERITYMKPKVANTCDPSKFRPITCLTSFYKIITACIADVVGEHCEHHGLIVEQQKGCKKGAFGCKEQLVVDSIIMKQAQVQNRNLHRGFVDYKKAYDMMPHSWLLFVLRLNKICEQIQGFLAYMMQNWRTAIVATSGSQQITTAKVSIKRGIFQGDTFSPLWFCLGLNPLSVLLEDSGIGFDIKFGQNEKCKISHLFYMDDVKLYASSLAHLKELYIITEKFSSSIRMEFGIEKCRTQTIIKGKIKKGEDIETTALEKIVPLDEHEMCKYLGVLQNGRILPSKQNLRPTSRPGLNKYSVPRSTRVTCPQPSTPTVSQY